MGAAPYILSLDIATKTGVAEGRAGESPRFYTLDFARGGGSHGEIGSAALGWIAQRLTVGRPDVIYLEAPLRMGAASGQTNADTVLRLYGLYYVMLSAATRVGVRTRDVNVQDARGAFLGNRTVPRDTAKQRAMAMCQHIGWTPGNLDEADAGAVHWFAMLKEAPGLAPQITPMDQHRIATHVEQEAIAKAAHRRQRAIEVEGEKRRKAERKAGQLQAAQSLFSRGRA